MMLWTAPLLPILAAPLVYLGGHRGGHVWAALFAVLIVAVELALIALAIGNDWRGSYALTPVLVLQLGLTPLSSIVSLTAPAIALPILLFAGFHESASRGRLLAIMVAFLGAMELLMLAQDLLTLLIGWELIGACSWALISHHWREKNVPRDAIQVFIVTRFGDLGLYIAAAALFAGSGSFGYQQLSGLDSDLMQVAAAGILLAAAAKSAQLPFSAWLFAAMSGPVPVSALLHAATLVAAGLYLLARLQPLLAEVTWLMPMIIAIGLATALAGGVVGILQGHAKKLLAASTSAQYGLMWVAVGVGFPGVALLHFLAHGFFKAGLFLATGIAGRQAGSYQLERMRLGQRLPGIALLTAIPALALAGLAPLGAAWTKEQIVSTAHQASLWLALGVVLAGGFSAIYATRFQLLMFGHSRRREQRSPRVSWAESLALLLLAGVTLGLSVLWWPTAEAWLPETLGLARIDSHRWLLVLSLVLVMLGIAIGALLVSRRRAVKESALASFVAAWWGLVPLTYGIGSTTLTLSRNLARFDAQVLEAATHTLAGWLQGASRGVALADAGIVDASLRGSARSVTWMAHFSAISGESLSCRLPDSLTGVIRRGGRWARRAQSGQTHHYYAGIAIGFAILLVILLLGEIR